MVKVSITLSNAQITLEAQEPEEVRQIVGIVLRELPRDLMLSHQQSSGGGPPPVPETGGNSVVQAPAAAAVTTHHSAISGQPRLVGATPLPPEGGRELTADRPTAEGSFTRFCHEANPLGDMRRVVVAAEGARRFLGQADVDAEALGRLFDLAGWRRPHSFTQTLRNSGRSTYRWLERVPGRAGRYMITDAGRAAALGE